MSITYAPASAPAGVAFNISVQFPPNNQISAQVLAAPSAHSIACPAMLLQMALRMYMVSPSGLLARMMNQIGETINQSNISAYPVRTMGYHSTDYHKDQDRHLTVAWSCENCVLFFNDSSLRRQASYGTDQALTLADDLDQNLGAVLGPAITKDGLITVTGIATSDQIVEVLVLASCFYVPHLCLQSRGSCIMVHAHSAARVW